MEAKEKGKKQEEQSQTSIKKSMKSMKESNVSKQILSEGPYGTQSQIQADTDRNQTNYMNEVYNIKGNINSTPNDTNIEKSNIRSRSKTKTQSDSQNQRQEQMSKIFLQLQCDDVEIQEYFSQYLDENKSKDKKIKDYQKDILASLRKQLAKGQLKIQETKPFPLVKRETNQISKQQQMRQELQIRRQQAIQKIKQIEQQQLALKKRAHSTVQRGHRNQSQSAIKPPPQTQKQQLKKALHQYRKFTQQLQRKEQALEEQRQQRKLLQLQKQQELMRLRRQSKRQEIKNNLRQIFQREKVRKDILQEWKDKERQIKNRKYLYIENRSKDKEQQQLKQLQKVRALNRIRANSKFDRQDIEHHQRKYQQLLQERRQMSKSLSASSVTNNSQTKKYSPTKFHSIVLKQIQEHKRKEIERLMKVKQNEKKEKISQYQERIDSEIKPGLKFKKFVPLPRCMSLDALKPQEQRQLGLKYLDKAKRLKKTEDQLKLSQMKKQSEMQLKLSRSKNSYKDYLKQIKKDIKYDPSERKLDEILLKKRNLSDYQTLKDAKYLSEYLVEKSKRSDQKKTMLAIKSKMDILNSIY